MKKNYKEIWDKNDYPYQKSCPIKGYSKVTFTNVCLPLYIKKEDYLNYDRLAGFANLLSREVDQECDKEALPIMQYLHNEGVLRFDFILAEYYHLGKAVKQDYTIAFQLFKELSLGPRNDSFAMNWLGVCYQYGNGTEINASEALWWYRKGSLYGNELATLRAGVMYASGFREVKRNRKMAEQYLKRVTGAGNPEYKEIADEWLNVLKIN